MRHWQKGIGVQVEVLTGPQGGGKSTVMREEAIATPGLYLFALPTLELIDEQAAAFAAAKSSLKILPVHQDSAKGAVSRRLDEARDDFNASATHGVVFITHESLMANELDGFDGWHVRVDEAPAAVQAGRFNIGVSTRDWLKNAIEVVGAPGSDWSFLSLKIAKPNWKNVERDLGAKSMSEFIKQVARPAGVFVKVPDWDAKDDIDWFSMWTPLSLSHFASIQIAGSSYTDSVGYRAARALFEDRLTFTEREIAPPRIGQPTISINYFTESHDGSTAFWGKTEGRFCIKHVCDYLGANLPASGFWSGNTVVEHLMDHRLPAALIRPLAMGLNKHRLSQACAFIFSSKATPQDEPLMTVFGLTSDDIRKAREDDAVAQFVMRGAIRDLDYDGHYTIYLYSKSQAERLRDHLVKIGFANVDVGSVPEAGILSYERPKTERSESTPEERETAKEARAVKARERAQKNRDKRKTEKAAAAETNAENP